MKKLLLCLLALIVVAPAWGGDAAPLSLSVTIEIKGSVEGVSALVAGLEKEAVYKDAACYTVPAKKSEKIARIKCAKADSELMAFLGKNTPKKVQWIISSSSAGSKCLPGCAIMNCPPPTGPLRCCNLTTHAPC